MGFTKQTIRDVSLKNKRVLMRVDYNVPLVDGKITSDYRITQNIPTIEYLLKQDCRIILMSHMGRPEGKPDAIYSLKPVAEHLAKLLKKPVKFAEDCVGAETEKLVSALKPGQILLLENVRFHSEEEAGSAEFAKKLASYGDIFVQDAFGVVHHGAVSVSEIPKYLPAVAGLLLEKEVATITNVMNEPKRPLVAIIGGAKISDKIKILEKFIETADFVAIGGAMANSFLLAEGVDIGKSLVDRADLPVAKNILAKARDKAKKGHFTFYIPEDGVVAAELDNPKSTRIVSWSAPVVADIESYPKQPKAEASRISKDEAIYDIGPLSASFIAGACQFAETVVWNGTMGVTEIVGKNNDPIGPFSHGTDIMVEALTAKYGHRPYTLVGGGDTAAYVEEQHLTGAFSHVSTGGGASLELMEGKKLPGIEALRDK